MFLKFRIVKFNISRKTGSANTIQTQSINRNVLFQMLKILLNCPNMSTKAEMSKTNHSKKT